MSDINRSSQPDVRVLAEAVVDVLVERGLLVAAGTGSSIRVLDAAQVGTILGRDRHWVYAHARELGAFRFGHGPRARLGFDLAAIERWKRAQRIERPGSGAQPPRRRRAPRKSNDQSLISYEPAAPAARIPRVGA